MCLSRLVIALLFATAVAFAANDSLEETARRFLIDLVRLDTTNPPGNETRVAQYLKIVCDAEGIENETLGGDPTRLNFLARIKGSGKQKPLLLMAHSDATRDMLANEGVERHPQRRPSRGTTTSLR